MIISCLEQDLPSSLAQGNAVDSLGGFGSLCLQPATKRVELSYSEIVLAMRATGYSRAGALLCLCLLFNSIAAELAQPARREESTLSTKVSPSKTLTNTGNKAASHTSSVNLDGSPADATTTSTSTPGTTSLSSAAPYSSIVMNGTLFECMYFRSWLCTC